jgi:hypothetical protein
VLPLSLVVQLVVMACPTNFVKGEYAQ